MGGTDQGNGFQQILLDPVESAVRDLVTGITVSHVARRTSQRLDLIVTKAMVTSQWDGGLTATFTARAGGSGWDRFPATRPPLGSVDWSQSQEVGRGLTHHLPDLRRAHRSLCDPPLTHSAWDAPTRLEGGGFSAWLNG
jgi:hypothetical protein